MAADFIFMGSPPDSGIRRLTIFSNFEPQNTTPTAQRPDALAGADFSPCHYPNYPKGFEG